MKTQFLMLISATLLSTGLSAADINRGQELAAAEVLPGNQSCATCHGINGDDSNDETVPVIAGQHADYLERALLDYQSGERVNVIMSNNVSELSKQDIEDLSAWFASREGLIMPRLSNRR